MVVCAPRLDNQRQLNGGDIRAVTGRKWLRPVASQRPLATPKPTAAHAQITPHKFAEADIAVKIEPFHLGHFDAVGPAGSTSSQAHLLTSLSKWEASIPFLLFLF